MPTLLPGQTSFGKKSTGWETVFDLSAKQQQIEQIDRRMGQPDFWNDQEAARQTIDQLKGLKLVVDPLVDLVRSNEDLEALVEMAADEEGIADEVEAEIVRLEKLVDELELKSLLNGPHDAAGALLSINARDGGTDANDWAEMMLRMYIQWAQKRDYDVSLMDRSDNDVAGINNATIAIRGPMAYGYLKGETGIHRLVRISPFNSEGKRQTSFAAVDVSPDVNDSVEIEVDEKDVREDTYRASGAGGQHVNKTDSAVRLTHGPSGIVVQCQNERSQHKNRASAWKMLRARLARLEDEKREAEQAQRYKDKARVGFGSQIRNYFKHPDQRVKDARTGQSVGNFDSVLDGNIQPFLESFLTWRIKQGGDD
jgi:peptide chain release factor 2